MLIKNFIITLATTAEVAAGAFCPQGLPFISRKSALGGGGHHVQKRGGGRSLPSHLFSSYNDQGTNGDAQNYFKDEFDMKELSQRIAEQSNPYYHLFMSNEVAMRPKPEDVHVLLFNPDTEQEGVHTIEFPRGSGNNVILAFESKRECDHFASILREQEFFDPTPQTMKLEFLEAYCGSLGVFVQVVPEGMELTPPTDKVNKLGHNPSLNDERAFLTHLFLFGDGADEGVIADDGLGSWE